MKIKIIAVSFLYIALSGCGVTPDFPERALVEPKHVASAISLAKEISQREDQPVPQGERWFEVVDGSIPVIVTAPHATRPLRNGQRRFSDGGGTAALAVALGELTGAHVIYTTYEGPSDPNYYDNNEFKETLGSLITTVEPAFILDIHGSNPFRSYDIDLGTMGGASLLGDDALLFELIEQLNNEGIESISYNRFGASKYATITKFSHRHNVRAIQLEINATYVMPSKGHIEAQRFSKMLQALSRFILQQDFDSEP